MLLLQAENVSAAVPFSNVTIPKVEDRSSYAVLEAGGFLVGDQVEILVDIQAVQSDED